MYPTSIFLEDEVEARENLKTVTVDVPVTFPEPLYNDLKDYADAHGTTIANIMLRHLPIFV